MVVYQMQVESKYNSFSIHYLSKVILKSVLIEIHGDTDVTRGWCARVKT